MKKYLHILILSCCAIQVQADGLHNVELPYINMLMTDCVPPVHTYYWQDPENGKVIELDDSIIPEPSTMEFLLLTLGAGATYRGYRRWKN